jgi:DNA (cytosine-5)-methyltransferase 1
VVNSLQILSLFCGPGGLDLGFKHAGFSTKVAFDIDEESVRTFNYNHANHKPVAFKYDLRKLSPDVIYRLAGRRFSPMGVIGGPPCQSFSVANVSSPERDPRSNLPSVYAKLLKELNARRPISFFLFENVPGLLRTKHRRRHDRFLRSFQEAGFDVFEDILDARDFGVPQHRKRLFVVGINRRLHPQVRWVWPQKSGDVHTVRDAISGLPPPIFNQRGLDPAAIPFHQNHWAMVPRSRKFQMKGALREGQSYGRSLRTLNWDEPSWTVAYGNREVHVHPDGSRRLSVFEAMLLQSFPPEYVLTGNISAQIRLVSDAVPPVVALHLAQAMRSCLGV